jgi:LysM repeat protein
MLLVPYAIRKNEYLDLIARRNRITLKQLLSYNPQIRDPDHVWVGTIIKVPIDNSIMPGDVPVSRDLGNPIIGPWVKAPDGTIIRLPTRLWLHRAGIFSGAWCSLTQKDVKGATVTGVRGVGYRVSFFLSFGETNSEAAEAAQDLGKDVAEHGAVEGGVHVGALPESASPMGIILSVINPSNVEGQDTFLVTADNGTRTVVTVLYPAEH